MASLDAVRFVDVEELRNEVEQEALPYVGLPYPIYGRHELRNEVEQEALMNAPVNRVHVDW